MQCGEVAGCAFVVARGDGTEMLETTEETFNQVALFVDFSIVRATAPLVGLPRDGQLDAAPPQEGAKYTRSIGLVGSEPFGTQSGASAPTSLDPALPHELFSHRAVMLLSRGQQQREGSASSIDTGMDFARQSTSTSSEPFVFTPAFFAPAACW